MDSDILGWHPDWPARYFIRVKWGRHPWEKKLSNINGLHIRLRWVGVCFHFGSGVYGGPCAFKIGAFKIVFYWMTEYQQWLESYMGY